MAQLKDREIRTEKCQFEALLGSSDQNPYFSQDVNSLAEIDMDGPRMTEELLVSTPLAELSLGQSKEPPPVVTKRNRPRRPRVYKQFADKYELTEEMLGRGSRSHVAVVKDRKTGHEFAVKIIDKTPGYIRSSILTEIDLLHCSKKHPNILTLIESFEEDHHFYLVFEMMKGGPLLQHIQRKERFTEREASLVVKDITNALKFLHDKGIAHRDLKPENILCQYENQIVPVKICDFDLASGFESLGCATPELYTPVGSAEYMAPEVVEAFHGDAPAYDKRCDLWSLGVILYIMLSGKAPFVGNCGEDCEWENGGSCYECQKMLWNSIKECSFEFPERDWGHISREAKDLVSKLLVKNASKRLTAGEVLNHVWVSGAVSEVVLKTPNVLGTANTEDRFDPFDLMSTEVLAYSRIMAEQMKLDQHSFTDIINEASWPKAGFGLSPPGKSDLARRRAEHVKKKEEKLKETLCAEEPVEAPLVTKRSFSKLSLPACKKAEETLRTP